MGKGGGDLTGSLLTQSDAESLRIAAFQLRARYTPQELLGIFAQLFQVSREDAAKYVVHVGWHMADRGKHRPPKKTGVCNVCGQPLPKKP
jgi:hypothetical protein